MRRHKDLFVWHSNTILMTLVFFLLTIDAKYPTSTDESSNLTEAFDNAMETNVIGAEDNESLRNESTSNLSLTSLSLVTPTDTMTSQSTLQNRLFLTSVTANEQPFSASVASSIDTASSHGTNATHTLGNVGNYSKSFSVTAFKTTTMKPFVIPTLPDFSRHRLGHKQFQSKMHHDRQFGPFFEDPLNTSGTLQLKFHEGTESILNCRVGMLKDKTVMWVRRTVDKVSLLTVGNVTYSGDPRIKVMFVYPNNWRLSINPIISDDAGLYMCQVSTHPPRVFATNVTVLAKAIHIIDEMGHEVSDRYYKLGSSVDVTCQVALSFLKTLTPPQSVKHFNEKFPTTPTTTMFPFVDTNLLNANLDDIPYSIIKWKKDGNDLPKDIKISSSTTHTWRNSRISIIHAERVHSGTYTCFVNYSTFSSVNIQILMGETPAAVQHNHCFNLRVNSAVIFLLGIVQFFCKICIHI